MAKTPTIKDAQGLEIPLKLVPKIDLESDRIANKIAKEADKLSEQLRAKKIEWLTLCDDWFEQLIIKLKTEDKTHGKGKGNYTITSYDKTVKIEINIGMRIEFDSKLQMAQTKINEYLEKITEGSADEIRLIVNNAFSTTRGNLDTKKIMSLFSYQIKHQLWLDAMEILKQSITTNVSKRYINIFRKDTEGKYQAILLQFSAL